MIPPPPSSTLFPYTTLFRSESAQLSVPIGIVDRPFDQRRDPFWVNLASSHFVVVGRPQSGKSTVLRTLITTKCELRSEEHTSELQSRGHLVCRLLLEKKKIR